MSLAKGCLFLRTLLSAGCRVCTKSFLKHVTLTFTVAWSCARTPNIHASPRTFPRVHSLKQPNRVPVVWHVVAESGEASVIFPCRARRCHHDASIRCQPAEQRKRAKKVDSWANLAISAQPLPVRRPVGEVFPLDLCPLWACRAQLRRSIFGLQNTLMLNSRRDSEVIGHVI